MTASPWSQAEDGATTATITAGQVASPHAHADVYEAFFVEAGVGTIRVDGEVYPFETGVCIAVAPGEVHEVVNTGSDELVLTYFGMEIGNGTQINADLRRS